MKTSRVVQGLLLVFLLQAGASLVLRISGRTEELSPASPLAALDVTPALAVLCQTALVTRARWFEHLSYGLLLAFSAASAVVGRPWLAVTYAVDASLLAIGQEAARAAGQEA